eukprot:11225953-Lingulodinium_polyedra.AAC.1
MAVSSGSSVTCWRASRARVGRRSAGRGGFQPQRPGAADGASWWVASSCSGPGLLPVGHGA